MLKNAVIPFTLGSSALNTYPILGPTSGEALHHFNMEMIKTAAVAQVKNQQHLAVQLREQHSDLMYAIGEVGSQIREQTDVISEGFEDVERAIEQMERAISAHLAGITFVLSQIDEKFTQLLHVVQFRRETETAELVKDGALALSKGYIDDAEKCFSEAERLKPVSYIVNLNLGFLSIAKDDVDAARRYFRKAADYADSDRDAQVFALENLARTEYVMGEFEEASRLAAEVLSKTERSDKTYQSRFFFSAFYLALNGKSQEAVKKFSELCLDNPDFVTRVALNEELQFIQRPFLECIDRLSVEKQRNIEKLISEHEDFYRERLAPLLASAHPKAATVIERAERFVQSISQGLSENSFSNVLSMEYRAQKLRRVGENCMNLVSALEQLDGQTKVLRAAEHKAKKMTRYEKSGVFSFLYHLLRLGVTVTATLYFAWDGIGRAMFTGGKGHPLSIFLAVASGWATLFAFVGIIGEGAETYVDKWLNEAEIAARSEFEKAAAAEITTRRKTEDLIVEINNACSF